MKKIPIVKKDIFALVDDDYEKLSKSVWYSCGGYAVCSKKVNDVWKRYIMHRIILNTPKGIVTDHINGVGWTKLLCFQNLQETALEKYVITVGYTQI